MKTIIRLETFETNSSSHHSFGIAPTKKYNEWEEGKLLYSEWSGNFISIEEAEKLIIKNIEKHGQTGSSTTKNLIEDETSKRLLENIENEDNNYLNNAEKLIEKRKEIIEEIYEEYGFFTYERYFNDCDDCFEETYTPKSTEEIVIFGTFYAD